MKNQIKHLIAQKKKWDIEHKDESFCQKYWWLPRYENHHPKSLDMRVERLEKAIAEIAKLIGDADIKKLLPE